MPVLGFGASGSRSGTNMRSTCFLPGMVDCQMSREVALMAQSAVSTCRTSSVVVTPKTERDIPRLNTETVTSSTTSGVSPAITLLALLPRPCTRGVGGAFGVNSMRRARWVSAVLMRIKTSVTKVPRTFRPPCSSMKATASNKAFTARPVW